ncbi:MAG: IPT/TIG domain-containing protein, partial [Dehalococcoidia bacterium]
TQQGTDNESLKETFMVTAPAVEVDPEAAPVGAEVGIIGTGFGVQQPLMSIKIGNVNVVWGQDLPITDSQGGFEVSATVPGLTPGGKSVSVEDAENNTYTVPFTITGDGETGVISVEDGLATIDGLYTIVWTFDSATQEWQVFDVAEGAPDDFTDLNKGQGYWIQVTEDCTLTYGSATYNLNEGWNLIGWLG